jgi:cytochrome b subunit of formate dehydrogenase
VFLLWLIIGCVIALSVVGGVILWSAVRRTTTRVEAVELRLRALQSDLAAICSCLARGIDHHQTQAQYVEQYVGIVEGRLEAMEQHLRQITRRQDEQLHTSDPGETSYGAAIRLAHQGADVEQLVNTFGMARGEAELIAALHRAQNEQSN